jgi:hypothetical protein
LLHVLQFCYTGRMGLLGNLSTAQIVEQLVEARRWLAGYTAQQQQQQPDVGSLQLGDAGMQQQGSSSSSGSGSRGGKKGKQKSGWQTQPPRVNNIVFM